MLLLVSSKIGTEPVNWWLNSIGCKSNSNNNVTRGELETWHAKEKRGIVESSSPLTILGAGLQVFAILLATLGVNQENNKSLTWGSILSEMGSLATLARGLSFTHDVICSARSKEINKEKETPVEDKIPSEEPGEATEEASLEETGGLRIHEGGNLADRLEQILEKEDNSNFDSEAIIEGSEKINDKLTAEAIIYGKRKTLSLLKKKGISKKEKEEAYADLEKYLPTPILLHGLLDRCKRVNAWATVHLLSRELTPELENAFIESIINNPQMLSVLSRCKEKLAANKNKDTADKTEDLADKANKILTALFLKYKTA